MSARRVGRPPGGGDGGETRSLILAEAERQFSAHGYAATNTKTIAEACQLTPATIYHHFGGKATLYEGVCAHVYPPMLAAFQDEIAKTETFRDRIRDILEAVIVINGTRQSLAGFVMGGPVEATRHPELRPVIDHHFSQLTAILDKVVDDARARGELRSAASTDVLTGMILAVLHGFAHLAFQDKAAGLHTQVIRAFEELIEGRLFAATDGWHSARRPIDPDHRQFGDSPENCQKGDG